MARGKVKWFNSDKGYGFIILDSDGQDVFVHQSQVVMEGYRTLREGQEVRFDLCEGERGLYAEDVVPV